MAALDSLRHSCAYEDAGPWPWSHPSGTFSSKVSPGGLIGCTFVPLWPAWWPSAALSLGNLRQCCAPYECPSPPQPVTPLLHPHGKAPGLDGLMFPSFPSENAKKQLPTSFSKCLSTHAKVSKCMVLLQEARSPEGGAVPDLGKKSGRRACGVSLHQKTRPPWLESSQDDSGVVSHGGCGH